MNKTASMIADEVLEKVAVSSTMAMRALENAAARIKNSGPGGGAKMFSRLEESPRTFTLAATHPSIRTNWSGVARSPGEAEPLLNDVLTRRAAGMYTGHLDRGRRLTDLVAE